MTTAAAPQSVICGNPFPMHHTVSVRVSAGSNEEVVGEGVRIQVRDVKFPHTSFFILEIPRNQLMTAIYATKSTRDHPITILGALVK